MLDERILNETDPRKLTINELRARCQGTAPAPERETFTGKTARVFSIYFTKYVFLKLPRVTPNWITVISVMVFSIGVSLFLTLQQSWSILGACLVYFATVLDGCDGETARFRKMKSPVGGVYAEPVSHDVQYGLMFLPLGLAGSFMTGTVWPLAFGFIAGATKLLTRLLETRYWQLKPATPKTPEALLAVRQTYTDRPAYLRLLSWIKRNTLSSNGMILPLLLAAITLRVPLYVYIYGTCYALLWVMTFLRQVRGLSEFSFDDEAKAIPGSAD